MDWYSPEELAIIDEAHRGNVDEARSLLSRLRPRLTGARHSLLLGKVITFAESASMKSAGAIYLDGIKEAHSDPATMCMLLVEASQVGVWINNTPLMKELWIRAHQLHVRYGDHAAVKAWYGASLINFANHRIRRREFTKALSLIEFAQRHLQHAETPWWAIPRAHYIRSWCLAAIGRPEEAQEAFFRMVYCDRDNSHLADRLLAESRILAAKGQLHQALDLTVCAERVAERTPGRPDWETILEAKYHRLLVSLRISRTDIEELAGEIRVLAHQRGFVYMLHLVKQACVQPQVERG